MTISQYSVATNVRNSVTTLIAMQIILVSIVLGSIPLTNANVLLKLPVISYQHVQIVNHRMIVPLTLTLTTVLMTVVALAMLMPKSNYALI